MRLLAVSDETPISGGCDSMAVGLGDPLVQKGAAGPANAATYCRQQLFRP